MYKLIRYFNQNRKKILLIVLIIVLIVIFIQLANYITKKNNNSKVNNVEITYSNSLDKDEKKVITSDKSLISGESVTTSKLKEDSDLISEFLDNCNNGNIEVAYELLSEDCKNVMFPTVDEFNNIYYGMVFNNRNRIYTIQNWNEDTYKVVFNEDSIDIVNNKMNSQTDYITIVEDNDGKYKLNINNFIGKKKLEKETEYEDILIKAQYLYEYIDYCEISFDIKNNTYRTILLDDLSNPYTMYLEDNNGIKYFANTNEIAPERLKLGIYQSTQINIKFYSKYSSSKKLSKVVFSSVVNNFETYNSLKDKSIYNQYYSIDVKI